MNTSDSIKSDLKSYIKQKIAKSDSAVINDDTKLISGGIMDSITTLQLVDFLEKKYHIEVLPHEVDREHLDSVDIITDFVMTKLNKS